MAWIIDLGTPYFRQDDPDSCGGAVAQMILDSIGAGLIDQKILTELNYSHSPGDLATSPDGLKFTLNKFSKSLAFGGCFDVARANCEPGGSAAIVRALRYFRVATGTLVLGCEHWVAVRGVKTDVDPAGDDGEFSIEGFYINNPWPPPPSVHNPALAPPLLHTGCGANGIGGERGSPNEYVSYAEWHNTYLTGCDVYDVDHLQFISVCEARRAPLRHLKPIGQVRMSAGSRLISADEAVDLANRALTIRIQSDQVCPLTPVLRGSRAVSAQLVQRLDRRDEFYYLIMLHRDGQPTAMLRGDGSRGTFQGAMSLDGVTHDPIIAPDAAIAAARQAVVDLGDGSGPNLLRDGALYRQPTLVWCPCKESCSPYYPFHRITAGRGTIYVGHDGTVYPTLHDLRQG